MVTRSSASTSKFLGDRKERGFGGAKSGTSGDAEAAEKENHQPVRPVLKSCTSHFCCVSWGKSRNLSECPLTFSKTGAAPTYKGCYRVSAHQPGKRSQRCWALKRCPFPLAPPSQVARLTHSSPMVCKSRFQALGTQTGQKKGLASQGAVGPWSPTLPLDLLPEEASRQTNKTPQHVLWAAHGLPACFPREPLASGGASEMQALWAEPGICTLSTATLGPQGPGGSHQTGHLVSIREPAPLHSAALSPPSDTSQGLLTPTLSPMVMKARESRFRGSLQG